MPATEQQQRVIDLHSGTILVTACPGSGKSTTLVNRCKALPGDQTKKVLMFNRNAKLDFDKKLGATSMCNVSTFHSYCSQELWQAPENYGYRPNAKGIKTKKEGGMGIFEQFKKANSMPDDINGWSRAGWDDSLVAMAECSIYTADLIEMGKRAADEMKEQVQSGNKFGDGPLFEKKVVELNTLKAIYKYRRWLIMTNQFTFASCVRTIAEHRANIRKAADHVMIDEYQDVDRFQFDIACALARAEGTKSFTVVGDPNQMIYAWRGALKNSFDMMLEEFPDAQVLPLTTNFRSYDGILRHADNICPTGMTGVRGDKENSVVYIEPIYETSPTGRRLVDQPKGKALKALLEDQSAQLGDDLSNFAILCRFNRQCVQWQIFLAKQGTPVCVLGKSDYWNIPHIKMAKQLWDKGFRWNDFLRSKEWGKFSGQKQFEDEEGQIELREIIEECKFIMELNTVDMEIIGKTFNNEREGIRISTIHKTKGAEWHNVMVYGVGEQLMSDKFLYYVACTRAQNKMVLA